MNRAHVCGYVRSRGSQSRVSDHTNRHTFTGARTRTHMNSDVHRHCCAARVRGAGGQGRAVERNPREEIYYTHTHTHTHIRTPTLIPTFVCTFIVCTRIHAYTHMQTDTAALYENEANVGKAVRECGITREEIFFANVSRTHLHTCSHAYPHTHTHSHARTHAHAHTHIHTDTAALYENEADVGKAVRECGIPRQEIFVTTKLWNDQHGYDRAKVRSRSTPLSSLCVRLSVSLSFSVCVGVHVRVSCVCVEILVTTRLWSG